MIPNFPPALRDALARLDGFGDRLGSGKHVPVLLRRWLVAEERIASSRRVGLDLMDDLAKQLIRQLLQRLGATDEVVLKAVGNPHAVCLESNSVDGDRVHGSSFEEMGTPPLPLPIVAGKFREHKS